MAATDKRPTLLKKQMDDNIKYSVHTGNVLFSISRFMFLNSPSSIHTDFSELAFSKGERTKSDV